MADRVYEDWFMDAQPIRHAGFTIPNLEQPIRIARIAKLEVRHAVKTRFFWPPLGSALNVCGWLVVFECLSTSFGDLILVVEKPLVVSHNLLRIFEPQSQSLSAFQAFEGLPACYCEIRKRLVLTCKRS